MSRTASSTKAESSTHSKVSVFAYCTYRYSEEITVTQLQKHIAEQITWSLFRSE
jgi:hypothetical protein